MVKIKKLWNIPFYKNDTGKGGAMNEAIINCPLDKVVFHSQTKKNGRLWGVLTPLNLCNLILTNKGIYEVITKFPCKMYFDIDKKEHTDDVYLNKIKNIILKYYPNANMGISGSITDTKSSYHIVLNNYVIYTEEERIQNKELVKYLYENEDDGFDWKVYTKNRNMKCVNQSKDDGRVQLIIENNDIKSHLITCFVPTRSLPFVPLPEPVKQKIFIKKSKKAFDVGILPKLSLITPDTFDMKTATPLDILTLLPVDKSFPHEYTHLVARFCYYNKISFEIFLSWIEKKHTGLPEDIVKKWQYHFDTIFNFPPVSHDKIFGILKYYYPHINKDIHFRTFQKTFQLPNENIHKVETLNQECFNTNEKYSILNTGMGSGKTEQTKTYLKKTNEFLWIAPNRALAINTQKRFEDDNNNDVFHYEEMTTKNKKNGDLNKKNKLIICLNSINYLNRSYKVLVIDEIETLIDKFIGDFLNQQDKNLKQSIWNKFINLFKNAEKVLLLDAFITTKTLNLIKLIENSLDTTIIYERINEPITRQVKFMENSDVMIQDIIDKLDKGNKLFIFYPYKNSSGGNKSMLDIFQLLEDKTGKKGIYYNADVDDVIKKGLKDVNTTWEQADFIVTNNIITCGLNYENKDFDYKYIFIASHSTPRDIIQVSYRARHITSGIIKICYMGRMNQTNTWIDDTNIIECSIYKEVFKNSLIEKKAPIKRAIQLFCKKAHYKTKNDDIKLNEALHTEIEKMLQEYNTTMTYNTIPNITGSEANLIEDKLFSQEATMFEKYSLNKYHFQKQFTHNYNYDKKDVIKIINYENNLGFIWNNKFKELINQLALVLYDDDNIFNKIMNLNNLDTIFPVDIVKTKINNEIREEVFKKFSFKYITNVSSYTKVLVEIYNTFFKKFVIKTKYKKEEDEDEEDDTSKKTKNIKSNNISYEVDEDVEGIYIFCKEHLILDRKTHITYNLLKEQPQDETTNLQEKVDTRVYASINPVSNPYEI